MVEGGLAAGKEGARDEGLFLWAVAVLHRDTLMGF